MQYKHKQTGFIAKQDKEDSKFYYISIDSKNCCLSHDIPYYILENSNDWEEIKEYTIISFSHQNYPEGTYRILNNITNYYDLNNPLDTDMSTYSEKDILDKMKLHNNFTIHSIRRNSDNQIFTIGDNTNLGIIIKFKIIDKKLLIDIKSNKSIVINQGLVTLSSRLKELSIKEKPIVIANDLEECYENQTIYGVSLTNKDEYIKSRLLKQGMNQLPINRVWFSTKNKAIDYLISNASVLSLNNLSYFNSEEDTKKYIMCKLGL